MTWRLESFTSLIPIPTFVYFVMVTGAFVGQERIIAVAVAGLLVGSGTVVWGILFRWFALKKLFSELDRLESVNTPETAERELLRNKFLMYPYREGRTIIARWSVGILAGAFVYIVQIKEIPFYSIFVEFYSLLFVLPISYVMYIFMPESVIRPILACPVFSDLPPAGKKIREISYFSRMLLAIISVTITPVAIFGFILYATLAGKMSFKNPEIHIVLLALEGFAAIIIVSYRTAKSVKFNINDTNEILQQLGKGNFSITSNRVTTDEFGRQSELLTVVTNDLSKMYNEVRELNENLEQKVIDRTEELNKTLEEVRKLKLAQDGDYFLTSLIIKPLNRNYVKSEKLSIEFLQKQKKKFEFKGKQHDIGGDICSAYTIRLRNKNYTAFMNADAMGKSMQGAGGALVLGSVYFSIIERTQVLESIGRLAPERWLKNTFLELHKVFESFDGSMLISVATGLVDDETGILYYINAEHPWTILYRDKQAKFIENELYFRKLGMSAVSGNIFIRVFQLEPDDMLICGSDGRDDILIRNYDGSVKMNEDPDLILQTVTEASGELNEIYALTSKIGEITDDFSLLKIFYKGAQEQNTVANIHKAESGKLYKEKEYRRAAEKGESYFNKRPSDTDFMRYLSRCHRLAGNTDVAIDLCERLRLRIPTDVRNLVVLTSLYINIGNSARAAELAQEIKSLDPQNHSLIKIEEFLQKKNK